MDPRHEDKIEYLLSSARLFSCQRAFDSTACSRRQAPKILIRIALSRHFFQNVLWGQTFFRLRILSDFLATKSPFMGGPFCRNNIDNILYDFSLTVSSECGGILGLAGSRMSLRRAGPSSPARRGVNPPNSAWQMSTSADVAVGGKTYCKRH